MKVQGGKLTANASQFFLALNLSGSPLNLTVKNVSIAGTVTDSAMWKTTTGGKLYQLPGGTRIIDTPGIRALGLWGVSTQELAWFFSEIAEASQGCKFRNCTHTHEPQCAVLDAVRDGKIAKMRHELYAQLLHESAQTLY